MPQNYKAILQYDGTAYHGWQIQANQPTIQAALRQAIHRITSEHPIVIGSGRTDAGVHAEGQVANFVLQRPLEPSRLLRSLNAVLPGDIRIVRLVTVPSDFHAQFAARQKVYWYRIWNSSVIHPFWRAFALHTPRPLDVTAMAEGASHLVGLHNFRAFAASSTTVEGFEREIALSRFVRRGGLITYQVKADGFLHHMVRNIIGTLLLVGERKMPPAQVRTILRSRNRNLAGPRAPAHGLSLRHVIY